MVYISTESRNPTFRPRNTGQRGWNEQKTWRRS
jgi:hypothetical protein